MTANYTFEWRISTCSFHTTFCRLKTRNTTLSIFIEQRIRGEPNQLFFFILSPMYEQLLHSTYITRDTLLYTLHAITMKRRIASIRLFNYITERISTKFQDWTNIWRVKLETNESETRRSGMERARRGRKYVQFRERWKYPRFHHSGNEDRNAFSSFSFSLFFFLDTACKPRRNQFNRQIIGIPEPGNFSRTDSTRCGSIKLEASPFLSLGDRFLSGKGREEEEEGEENLHLSKSKSS